MKPVLSVVAPVYNEADGIRQFIEEVANVVKCLNMSWELLLVNDGSTDGTLAIIKETRKNIPEIRWLNLSRNFGHQAAVTAGIDYALGDAVVIMDADMQDSPSLIPELIASWKEGNEVVFARRDQRFEKGIRKVCFDCFHRFFRYFIDFPIPPNVGVFSLLDRIAIDHIKQLPERNRFLPGLYSWVGFRRSFVDYKRPDRSVGEAKQKFRHLFKYAIDGVLSFSYKPIRILGLLGLMAALSAFLTAIFFAVRRLSGHEIAFTGFTTLVILISMIGGAILVAIAVVGEYVARIYDEVKARPVYIVRGTDLDSND